MTFLKLREHLCRGPGSQQEIENTLSPGILPGIPEEVLRTAKSSSSAPGEAQQAQLCISGHWRYTGQACVTPVQNAKRMFQHITHPGAEWTLWLSLILYGGSSER